MLREGPDLQARDQLHSFLIDLHSHTDESDGSDSPPRLIAKAVSAGIRALGITDHAPAAAEAGIELICGIELSTKLGGRSAHLLAYFLDGHAPLAEAPEFREWVEDMQASRRERNRRLAERLREFGVDITVDEAEARGRMMTGRPHFAQIMVEKGYVANVRQAFDEYLDESAKGYVYRREPQFIDAVKRVRLAGGIAALAHPVRVHGDVAALMPELCDAGMNAIEAYHSDHQPSDTREYLELARRYDLAVTGGSDFHGAIKPEVMLGTGHNGNLKIPADLVKKLRAHQK
jgi:3',5'-nucleoside bisphosphate phosphatase